MKSLVSLGLVILLGTSFRPGSIKVYVCDSSTSVAYHSSKSCKGLNRCTHQIIEVSKQDAIDKYGKRACKICY